MADVVRLIVEVHQKPGSELEDWRPPSASTVAAFIQARTSHVETGGGWLIGVVNPDLAYLDAEMRARKRLAAVRRKRQNDG